MSKIQEFNELRYMYESCRCKSIQTFSGKKKYVHECHVVTEKGEIEISEWISLIEKLIEKHNEGEIQKKLYLSVV
ncbi:MAG TPA: hypothetical protein GXX73_14255 [Clostridium sp.]|nr:hypothetical protein [Clostridium sp.]